MPTLAKIAAKERTVTGLVMVIAEVPSTANAPPVPTLWKVIVPEPNAEPLLKFNVP